MGFGYRLNFYFFQFPGRIVNMFFIPNHISPLLSKIRRFLSLETGAPSPHGWTPVFHCKFPTQPLSTLSPSSLCTSVPTPPLPPAPQPPAQSSTPGYNCQSILQLFARRIRRRRRHRSAPDSREDCLRPSSRESGPKPY